MTAGGFSPRNNNVLILTTSSNQVYALDVEERKLGDWSRQHTYVLPKRFQEFPGEVIGLSFPPSPSTTSVIVYSARYFPVHNLGLCYIASDTHTQCKLSFRLGSAEASCFYIS